MRTIIAALVTGILGCDGRRLPRYDRNGNDRRLQEGLRVRPVLHLLLGRVPQIEGAE
jgi:hypothetical protein